MVEDITTIPDPTSRPHAEFWRHTGQLHPAIDLAHNEATLPTDHGGRVGSSIKWWSQGESNP
ncbi:hypothetical protein DEF23_04635 [Marinitenerispora sediminis]|uniref:Uncharacterized protein n=1 Tax=Marinitenerispora sediminis TaxID=1931232 RepID=A0A368T2K9_9ACTN|nr:hypothetical protein DEF28_21625 [Marinitenerispora sediminis]RCV55939.1 hypothetical protein DEF24_17320 [Marinitenerispora sediminis]RCV60402.1 hypothetical protein DEF23_04635 [Marinitenerispora sediminis]